MLDEASATFLASMAESGLPPLHELTPRAAREAGARMAELYGRGPAMARVEDIELGRLFVPNRRARGVIVYYHGGGWVLGTPDQFDALARRLAAGTTPRRSTTHGRRCSGRRRTSSRSPGARCR
jgi:acetyl esterase